MRKEKQRDGSPSKRRHSKRTTPHPFMTADISEENQERVHKALLEVAAEQELPPERPKKSVAFLLHNTIFRKPPTLTTEERKRQARAHRLQQFLHQIAQEQNFCALIQLHTRYKGDESKADEFEVLDNIIRDQALENTWTQILQTNKMQRYRLKGQHPDEPDSIHPFELLAGKYFQYLISCRDKSMRLTIDAEALVSEGDNLVAGAKVAQAKALKGNSSSAVVAQEKAEAAKEKYAEAYDCFRRALIDFIPTNDADSAIRFLLLEQYKILKAIEDWGDPANLKIAGPAFKIIKELSEKVYERLWVDLEKGMQQRDFVSFSTAQILDNARLYEMHNGRKLYKSEVSSLTENLFTKPAVDLIERIESRFNTFRDIFIWPSYLSAAQMHYRMARRYAILIEKLLTNVDDESRRSLLLDSILPTHSGAQLTRAETELLEVVNVYKTAVKDRLDQAITCATAARDLQKSGRYDAIADAATEEHLSYLLVLDLIGKAYQCHSLDEFVVNLKEQAAIEWEDINRTCNLQASRIKPTPPDCRQDDVDAILERHEAVRLAAEKASTAICSF